MTCAPTATRTRDLPFRRSSHLLRRSSHLLGPTAASQVKAGFLGVWLASSVWGSRPVLARGWYGRPLIRSYSTCARQQRSGRSACPYTYTDVLGPHWFVLSNYTYD
jgi:hypothetical protein